MENIEISVCGNRASVISSPMLTSGTVGLPVAFKFDQQWNELSKTAVFKAGNVVKDQVNIENTTIVPHEVLLKPKKNLEIGVYGVSSNGDVVIPTIWVNIGVIQPGADPSGDESADPTLPVWEQVAKDTLKYVKQNLTPLDMSGHKVFNVADGEEDSDAATVGQVKEMIKEAGGGSDPVPDQSIYFDIDDYGSVSLKTGYQAGGELNDKLPEKIIIPDVVNGTAVTALQDAMFKGNKRVKSITIPSLVTAIPQRFAELAINLAELKGTENVETIGSAAFQTCGIKKALFPNLKSFTGGGHFNQAPNLAIVDIGNTVTAIPDGCFQYCESLSAIRGGASVTKVGLRSMAGLWSLLGVSFLSKLTSVGKEAFLFSRVTTDFAKFDWWTFKNSGCSFNTEGYNPTPAHYNASIWWTGTTYTACKNPLGSTFHQGNPKWAGDTIKNSSDTYGTGCLEVSTAHIYSALTGDALICDDGYASPRHFVENIVGGIDNGRLLTPTGTENGKPAYTYADMANWLSALGLNCELLDGGWNKDNLQMVYDALEEGALVLTYIYPGHAGVIYGVTENKEVMVLDSSSYQKALENYVAVKYKMKIQNLTIGGGSVMIVKKGGIIYGTN